VKAIASSIDKKFGVDSFIGISQKGNAEELYFCVNVPTEREQQKTASRITDALNFPLEYDQLQNGRRTKFIAIPLDDLLEVKSALEKLSSPEIGVSVIPQSKIEPEQRSAVSGSGDSPSPKFHLNTSQESSNTQNPKEREKKGNSKQFEEADSSQATVSDTQNTPEITSPKQQTSNQSVKREEWEKNMLILALASLKDNPANAGEEMQTATFAQGKYRVIHHTPSQMLRIVDEENQRGTLYKVQKGKPVQVCEFTELEKRSFELSSLELEVQVKQNQTKKLQQE
jgi:hypothetical protein